jgi:cystathionine gamma-synthase
MLAAIDAGLLRRALVVARRGCSATRREGGDGPMQPPPPLSPETLAAQALGDVDPVSGGLTPGINPSTSYEQLPDGSYRQDRVYTRADNPTYETAEGLLAALEGAGCACALFASGMAAATAIFQSLLPGDHVLGAC